MGAALMANTNIESLLNKYDSVRECVSCSRGVMVPSTITYKKPYGEVTLLIEDLPVFKCLESDCNYITIGTGTLLRAIRGAKKNYDTSGEVVYKLQK